MIEIITGKSQIIQLSGELNRFDPLDKLTLPNVTQDITVDVDTLSVDTAGLAWLLQQKIIITEQGHQLAWLNPSDDLINLAMISGVSDILGV